MNSYWSGFVAGALCAIIGISAGAALALLERAVCR
jgi:hypothetical protein